MGNGGAQLFTELIEEFYNRAYQDGVSASQLLSEGSFSYRQGYENGRRDAMLEGSGFNQDLNNQCYQ